LWLKLQLLLLVARVVVVPHEIPLEHVVVVVVDDRVEMILVNVVEMDSWHHPFRVVTSLTTWDDDDDDDVVIVVVVVDRIDNAMAIPDADVADDDEDDKVRDDRVLLDDDDSHFVGVWAMSRLQDDWLLLLHCSIAVGYVLLHLERSICDANLVLP
jgi:hypothetical protein